MVANLNIQGVIPGQETGKSANKKTKSVQTLELINLIQDAIGQGIVTKQGKFSDVLSSLKQTQSQSIPTAPQKYSEKAKECPKVQPLVKNSYVDSSTPTKKILPKELPSFKEKLNEIPQINNTKINVTEVSQNNTNVSIKDHEDIIEGVLHKDHLSTLNRANALEYDFLTINNLQGKGISFDSAAPSLTFTNTSTHKVDPQLRSQLDQWVGEGKVQIHKLGSPLEIEQPIIINFQDLKGEEKVEKAIMIESLQTKVQESVLISEPLRNQIQDTVLRSELLRGQIQDTALKSESLPNSIQETVLKSDINPGKTQNSLKISNQQIQPLQGGIPASQQKIAVDESILLATKTTDNTKTIEPNITQVVPSVPVAKAIDKPLDRPLIQNTNSLELEEADIGKIGLGQNRILQNSSEKIGGKIGIANKSFTMEEKIQTLQQVKSQMKAALQKGETHLLVKLTPDDLGKVDIKLDISKDGNVSAFFRAENRETMVLLSKYADDFRQIFGDSGLTSDMSGMNFSSSDQQTSQFDQVAKSIGKNFPTLDEQEEIISLAKINTDMHLGLSLNQRLNITV